MIYFQLKTISETFNLYSETEKANNLFEAKLQASKETIQAKIYSRINGKGSVNLGSNKLKKRSSSLKITKFYKNETEYRTFANKITSMIQNNSELDLVAIEGTLKRTCRIINIRYKETYKKGLERRLVNCQISFDFKFNYWEADEKTTGRILFNSSVLHKLNLPLETYTIQPKIILTPNNKVVDKTKLYIKNKIYSDLIGLNIRGFGTNRTDKVIIDSYNGIISINERANNGIMDSSFPKFEAGENEIFFDLSAAQSFYAEIKYKERYYV